jgi:polyhydroxyalkanoate synthesis regulator phasin
VSVATDTNRELLEEFSARMKIQMKIQMEETLDEKLAPMKRQMEETLDEKLAPMKRQIEETTQELSRLNKRTGILVEEKARVVATEDQRHAAALGDGGELSIFVHHTH